MKPVIYFKYVIKYYFTKIIVYPEMWYSIHQNLHEGGKNSKCPHIKEVFGNCFRKYHSRNFLIFFLKKVMKHLQFILRRV